MLDSPPTCHTHDFLNSYKNAVCNTESPVFDPTLKHFFHICRQLFTIPKDNNFNFLTCYSDACGYIKKVWIVDNAVIALYRLFDVHLYGLAIVKVG